MKLMYRATLRLLGAHFAEVKPSNIFLLAIDMESAILLARETYEEEMVKYGLPRTTPYDCQVIRSSEEEVEEYRKGMEAGQVSRMVS